MEGLSLNKSNYFRKVLGKEEACDITTLNSIGRIVPNRNVNLMALWRILQSYQENVKYKNKSFGLNERAKNLESKFSMTILEFNRYFKVNTLFIEPRAGFASQISAFFRKLSGKFLYISETLQVK